MPDRKPKYADYLDEYFKTTSEPTVPFRSTLTALTSPGDKMLEGVDDLQDNPLMGTLKIGLGIAETSFLPFSLPFAIADDMMSKKEGGGNTVFSRINEGMQGVMNLPSNAVDLGTHYIDEGLKALGVDTEKIDKAIMFELWRRGLAEWNADPKELAAIVDEYNKMGATLLTFKKAHDFVSKSTPTRMTKKDYNRIQKQVAGREDIGIEEAPTKGQITDLANKVNEQLRGSKRGEENINQRFKKSKDKVEKATLLKDLLKQKEKTKTLKEDLDFLIKEGELNPKDYQEPFEFEKSRTKPVEGLTQEKLPIDLAKEKLDVVERTKDLPTVNKLSDFESNFESVGIKRGKDGRYSLPNKKGRFNEDKAIEEYNKLKEQDAVNEGKPVPQEVLKPYTDLQPKLPIEKVEKPVEGIAGRTPKTTVQRKAESPKYKSTFDINAKTGNATLDRLKAEVRDEMNKAPSLLGQGDVFIKSVQVGAIHLKNGLVKFSDWSKQMIKDLGEKIKPHLLRIWSEIKKFGADLGKIAVEKIGEFVESKYNPARPLKITQEKLFEIQNRLGVKESPNNTSKTIPETKFWEDMKEVSKTDREILYQQNERISTENNNFITKLKEKITQEKESVNKVVKTVLEPITTSIYKISPDIYRKFRSFSNKYQLRILGAHKIAGDYFEKKENAKMPDNTVRRLDLALKNGWMDDAHKIAKQYGFDNELNRIIKLKDMIAEELGVEMIKDHFPRVVEDFDGFVKFLEEKYPDYYKDNFSRMIAEKSQKIGRALTTEEKAKLINDALRGYDPGIKLSDLGNMRKRIIETLDGEMNKFYASSDKAIISYLNDMIRLAEARRFFGDKGYDITESIGQYIQKLREGKKLDIEGSRELTDIFNSYFNQRPITAKSIQNIRNIGVITKLANPFGTLTQLKDLAYSIYMSPTGTVKSLAEIISGKIKGEKPTWTIEEMGVDPLKIAEELANPSVRSKVVQKFLDLSGFSKMDMMGKETLINTAYRKALKESRKTKLSPDFERRINRYFGEGKEKADVLNDLRNGRKTDRTAFYLFNELMGAQPISLAELPRGFLKGGNWRVAYFLKTFTIRQLDFFLNETIRVMTDKSLPKEQRIAGGKNLMKLMTTITLMGASVDTIKNWILGRDANVLGDAVDNLMSVALLSKFDYTKARLSGLTGAIGSKILPPLDFISDPLIYDLPNILGEKGKTLKSTKHIPIIGRWVYEALRKKGNSRYNKRPTRRQNESNNLIPFTNRNSTTTIGQ